MMTAATIVSWLVGFAFLALTFRAIHKDKGAIASAWGFIAAFFILCGMPWFQGLAKTWIVSNVGARLTALSRQMDDVEGATARMQTELAEHQTEIDKHHKELDGQQRTLRSTHTNLVAQADKVSNTVQKVSLVEASLTAAQTNITAQQEKLTNVESLVHLLFSNTEDEVFSTADTNKVAILHLASVQMVCFRLNYAPIPNTVTAMLSKGHAQTPLLPEMGQGGNILTTKFFSEVDLSNVEFHFRYIKDTRINSLAQTLVKVDTNAISIDGSIVRFH